MSLGNFQSFLSLPSAVLHFQKPLNDSQEFSALDLSMANNSDISNTEISGELGVLTGIRSKLCKRNLRVEHISIHSSSSSIPLPSSSSSSSSNSKDLIESGIRFQRLKETLIFKLKVIENMEHNKRTGEIEDLRKQFYEKLRGVYKSHKCPLKRMNECIKVTEKQIQKTSEILDKVEGTKYYDETQPAWKDANQGHRLEEIINGIQFLELLKKTEECRCGKCEKLMSHADELIKNYITSYALMKNLKFAVAETQLKKSVNPIINLYNALPTDEAKKEFETLIYSSLF